MRGRFDRVAWSRRRLAVALGLLSVGATMVGTGAAGAERPMEALGVLAQALAHVRASYVEVVRAERLVRGAIRGMLEELDPHSVFLDPEEYRLLSSDVAGRYVGIGVEVSERDGWLTVVSVFRGAPAERAGLRPGDRILAIDERDARDVPVQRAVRWIRGPEGSTVRLLLRRPGREARLEVQVRRGRVEASPVEGRLLPGPVAYVRFSSFSEGGAERVERLLRRFAREARRRGAALRGVLLDLRSNPGGLVEEAVRLADAFLAEGEILVVRGRAGRRVERFEARKRGTLPPWPLVLLVDGGSASASEIVAGALQDHGRALLVGERTFGKGSVQHVVELADGSALKLTVARYYTPSGRDIQATGIAPDLRVERLAWEGTPDARERPSERDLRGHLRGAEEREGGDAASAGRRAPRHRPTEERDREPFAEDLQARVGWRLLLLSGRLGRFGTRRDGGRGGIRPDGERD